ncbi:Aste57867_25529 [Aphanomyces stellatus]|uniref:1,3-beta-glucan synthase n=1 Tax=Aphanomyces stellatus TaxID=120398 RepID=A0A485LUQ0_9STRA|nr:hypothetical protein As57867_025450 [Aphanomyces stellatus]VFU02152.1 Aste57867_25529 [Aphanomyces stellatus]
MRTTPTGNYFLPDATFAARLANLDIDDTTDFVLSIEFGCHVLCNKFGFQEDSVENQREHALLLLANAKARGSDKDYVSLLHDKLFGNYTEWCRFLHTDPVWYTGKLSHGLTNRQFVNILLYLCIWGEAANLRHMPECLCYIYHQMMLELNTDPLGTQRPKPDRWYLNRVVRPIYDECAGMLLKEKNRLEHTNLRNYDDLNEFFWRHACLDVPIDQIGDKLQSLHKTYYEHRSILTLVLNYYRLFHFNLLFLVALIVLQYAVTISPNGAMSGLAQFHALGQAVPPYSTLDLKLALVVLTLAHSALGFFKGVLELAHSWHLLTSKSKPTSCWTYTLALFLRLFWNGAFSAGFLLMLLEGASVLDHPWLDRFNFLAPIFIGPAATLHLTSIAYPGLTRTAIWGKFIREGDSCYVGRNILPPLSYRLKYIVFWLLLWALKAFVSYTVLVSPLMLPSLAIYNMNLTYTTNVVSFRNIGVIAALWAPIVFVFCYDTQIYFTIFQALYGAIKGFFMHTGEYYGYNAIHKALCSTPAKFDTKLATEKAKKAATMENATTERFAFVWNRVIHSFRQGDLLNDREAAMLRYDIDTAVLGIAEPPFLSKEQPSATLPRCPEVNRRLGYFLKSLTMDIPQLSAVKAMRSFSVMTPFYGEDVLYSLEDLSKPLENHPIFKQVEERDKNLTLLKYLITIHTAEWANFTERVGLSSGETSEMEARRQCPLELRLWASNRGQTLARTVEGMMLYEDAIQTLLMLEIRDVAKPMAEKHAMLQDMVRLKFSYVCACQKYGDHKKSSKTLEQAKAEDIDYLLQEYPNLRVAYVDKTATDVFSTVLIKWDTTYNCIAHVFKYELPGNPILGEGKPENQNNAMPFTRGEFLQTIDMNQQHYFEECLKMPNLLVTADHHPSGKPVSIIGMREHIFTGDASSLSMFKSWQELVFVTLSQRVLADPLYVRMHYGHPDVFDKVWSLTRGGVSKASKGINLSEDVFAGFNCTLRGGVVTHVEFMQCGKGRDVALSQISMFEGKLANGAGETSLAREAHRMGAFLDFFRLNSMYYSHTGFYFATWLTVVTAYVFIYAKVYLALTGVEGQIVGTIYKAPIVWANQDKGFTARATSDLNNDVNTQYYIQAGLFLTLPLLAVYFTEAGLVRGLNNFVRMILSCGWAFFTFQVGTTAHFFDLNIVHGKAKYQATGRGFKITRESFVLFYRSYSGSHYRKAMELIGLCAIYGFYSSFHVCELVNRGATYCSSTQSYGAATFPIWFISVLWLISPMLFNSDGLNYKMTLEDVQSWASWLYMERGTVDQDKALDGGWIGWWQSEVEQFNGSKFISRLTVFVRESRHFVLAYFVIKVVHSELVVLYTAGAVVVTPLLMQLACSPFQSRTPVVRVVAYVSFFSAVVVGYLVTTITVEWNSPIHTMPGSLSILYGFFTMLYGLNEIVRVWPISESGYFQQLAFFFDLMVGLVVILPLLVLSFVPFLNIVQTRMMFNERFSQVMSDSDQFAYSIAALVGFAGACACGWAYSVLTSLDYSLSFLAHVLQYNVMPMDQLGHSTYYAIWGAVGGALLSSVIAYCVGRRITIYTSCFLAFVSMTLLSGASVFGSGDCTLPSIALFGVAIGVLLPSICLYCDEIAPYHKRPEIMLVVALGYILGSLAASYFTHGRDPLNWTWQLFYSFLICVLLAGAIHQLPESPAWTLARHGEAKANAALVHLRRRTDVIDELHRMKQSQTFKRPLCESIHKAIVGFLFTIVLSLSLGPLNLYVVRVFGSTRVYMLTYCLALELVCAIISITYVTKFAHRGILTMALFLVGGAVACVIPQVGLFRADDTFALTILFLCLYGVMGFGFPGTLWAGVVGMFRTRGRFVSIPIYFMTFFGLHVATTAFRLDAQTSSSTSKDYLWLFTLTGVSGLLVFAMCGLHKRRNGMFGTAFEVDNDEAEFHPLNTPNAYA